MAASIEPRTSAPKKSWCTTRSLSRRETRRQSISRIMNADVVLHEVSANAKTMGGLTLLSREASVIRVNVCSSLITGQGPSCLFRNSSCAWQMGNQEGLI